MPTYLYHMTFDSNAEAFAAATKATLKKLGGYGDNLQDKFGKIKLGATLKRGLLQAKSALNTVAPIATGLAGSFVSANAELEVLKERMDTAAGSLEGGAKAYKQAMGLAVSTPFGIEAVADSFAKLEATEKIKDVPEMIEGLADAIAAFGGGPENLRLATVAIYQMTGKGKVYMEELRRQFAEQVPTAMQAMADGLGYTLEELFEQIEGGNVEALEGINAMMSELDKRHGGAAERLMGTYRGQIVRLQTEWKLFMGAIGDSEGSFASISGAVSAIADALNTMRTSEEHGAVIEKISNAIAVFFEKFQDPKVFEQMISNFTKTLANMLDAMKNTAGLIIDLMATFDSLSGAVSQTGASRLGIDMDKIDSSNYFQVRDILVEITDLQKEVGHIPPAQMAGSYEELVDKFDKGIADKIQNILNLRAELKLAIEQPLTVGDVNTVAYEEQAKAIEDAAADARKAELDSFHQWFNAADDAGGYMKSVSKEVAEQQLADADEMYAGIEERAKEAAIVIKDEMSGQVIDPETLKTVMKADVTVNMAPGVDEAQWNEAFKSLQEYVTELGTIKVGTELAMGASFGGDSGQGGFIKASFQAAEDALPSLNAEISPELDKLMWEDAFFDLQGLVDEFGGLSTDIDLELAEAEIQELNRLLQDFSYRETSDPNDVERVKDLLDYWQKIAMSAETAGASFPLEELNKTQATLESMAEIDISLAPIEDFDEMLWEDAFFELQDLVDSFGGLSTDIELELGEEEIQQLNKLLQDFSFRETVEPGDIDRVRELVRYWEEVANKTENAGYAFPTEELEKTKQNLANLSEENSNLSQTTQDVSEEVDSLETNWRNSTQDWMLQTEQRIGAIDDLTEAVERLGRASEDVALPSGSGAEGRYAGGPVAGGTPYVVGERGPELFIPGSKGNIIPNNELGGGEEQVAVNFSFNGRNAGSMKGSRQTADNILEEFARMQGAMS